MGTCIAIANQKGGVTKTTSTYNVATLMAQEGFKVLMIDLDAQCSLTISAGIEPDDISNADTAALLQGRKNAKSCICRLRENLDMIPSNPLMAGIEETFTAIKSREGILKRALKNIINDYDYIFIDCPPQLSLFTVNALVAAQYVLIPCSTTYLSFRGVELLMNTIREITELELNPKLKVMGVVATLYEKNVKDHREVLDVMRDKYDVIAVLRKTVEASKGIYNGLPVVLYNQNHELTRDYIKLTKSIIAKAVQ